VTVFSQPLRAAFFQGSIAQIRQHIGIHLAARQGEAERRDPDLALLSLATLPPPALRARVDVDQYLLLREDQVGF